MSEQEKAGTPEEPENINTETGDIDDGGINEALPDGADANALIEKQGDDAAAGILRDTDAAKHQRQEENE